MAFKKAERKRVKLRLALAGISGSGKTWSSLLLATGMGGKIALLDTEKRGELYAEDFDYEIEELSAPFSPARYIEKIKEAERNGFDILIIDSLSHAWVGDGGVLSIVERSAKTFSEGWKTGTPQHNALVETIIQSKMHIIITLRTKADYVMETNEKGKMVPRKVGTAIVQRDNLDYEFTVFMEIGGDNVAHFSKDNTRLYHNQYLAPTKEMGAKFMEWLNTGKSAEDIKQEEDQEKLKAFSLVVDSLISAESLDDLKDKFIKAHKDYESNAELLAKLTQTKDSRKAELMDGQSQSIT